VANVLRVGNEFQKWPKRADPERVREDAL